jgi:uncharacterized phage protein gp47/JayE
MSSFTPDGIIVDRQVDVFDKLIADLKSLWGENIRTSADSVIGSLMTIISEAIADQNELVEAVVAAFQPSKAIGVFLSEIVRFNGIDRNESEFSTVSLDLTANTAGSTVPAGTVISDPLNPAVKFEVDNNTVVGPSATVSASATAVDAGPVAAAANTLTNIDNPIFGLASVTNPADAIEGANEEKDPDLRFRRDRAAEIKASGSDAAAYTALADLQNVTDVYVHSNRGSTVDQYGVGPGRRWCIIEGGNDADIAEAINVTLPGGIGTFGAVSFPYLEPVQNIVLDTDGSGGTGFSRPDEQITLINLTLNRGTQYPGDGDETLLANLKLYFEQVQKLGVPVEYFELLTPINGAPSLGYPIVLDKAIVSLTIAVQGDPLGTADLPIAINQKAVTGDAYINIL